MRDLAVMGLVEVLPRLRLLRPRLRPDGGRHRRPPAGRAGDHRQPRLHPARAEGDPRRSASRARITSRRRSGRGARAGCAIIPGLWDKLLCLLPFEPAFFARHGLPARFVGHPVLECGAGPGRRGALPRPARPGRGRARAGADAGQPAHRGAAAAAGVRRDAGPAGADGAGPACRCVPVSAVVAETVQRAAAAWPVRPIIVTELDDKHDAYAAAGVGADQIRHLHAGAGAGRRADGGDLPGQPGHRRDRPAADPGAARRDGQPAGRAGGGAGTAAGGLHAGAAEPDVLGPADRCRAGGRGAARRVSRACWTALRPGDGLPSEAAAREVLEAA